MALPSIRTIMKHLLISTLLLGSHLLAAEPQHYDIAKRASEIDPRAKEHPAIKFNFTDDRANPLTSSMPWWTPVCLRRASS
jgi:hypothetical protein